MGQLDRTSSKFQLNPQKLKSLT